MKQHSASSSTGDMLPAAADACDMREQGQTTAATALVNLIPPATLVAVVLFWVLVPEALVKNAWTLTIVGVAIMAWIQGLEFIWERHAGLGA